MSGNYWIKLYIEIIDDPKMATLPDRLWRRVIELFLLAGKMGENGLLPTTSQLAWLMRMDTDDLELDMQQLCNTGIIEAVPNGWNIPKFKKRQEPIPSSIRAHEYRKRMQEQRYYQNDEVTEPSRNVTQINRLTDTETDTESEADAEKPKSAAAFEKYEKEIGLLTPMIADKINLATEEYTDDWICRSIDEAVVHNARNWAYCEAILKRWKVEGFNNGRGKKKVVDRSSEVARERYGGWEQ